MLEMREIYPLPSPSLLSFPFSGFPFPPAFPFLPLLPSQPLSSFPLGVGPLKSSCDVWAVLYVSSASRVWGRALAEIEFGAFLPKKYDI